ncbi:hypothetical protein FF38_07174 [Lucilia cuprina]|uniref:Uncharacterized protein n=1 Tax=Lucilia cuprina TaxID=7375 RepID=A0A0L0BST0_LUCCU|nr:hypothetical protein FF38_07174 [Lucilia cuprina]
METFNEFAVIALLKYEIVPQKVPRHGSSMKSPLRIHIVSKIRQAIIVFEWILEIPTSFVTLSIDIKRGSDLLAGCFGPPITSLGTVAEITGPSQLCVCTGFKRLVIAFFLVGVCIGFVPMLSVIPQRGYYGTSTSANGKCCPRSELVPLNVTTEGNVADELNRMDEIELNANTSEHLVDLRT